MDLLNKVTGSGSSESKDSSKSQGSGGGGIMDKMNTAAGGGRESEKNEDGLE